MLENIFKSLPPETTKEVFDVLLQNKHIRIERIVSAGHTSPASGWYDQEENEWVIVLEGAGTILFEDGRKVTLNKGDFLHIPAHEKHKVAWTDPDRLTIWLAVHYSGIAIFD
ncbi:cupin domain-containing protein [Candidatus Electronema sp. JC]|uniref:cupin domain-containing protein n=1 Tax=Candidatus Electronema sp. JC TaxID=3401570 RepID=UPI003B434FF5